jgi:hypothetical protein
MRRRAFLKLIGLTSAWAALAGPSAVAAATASAAGTGSTTVGAPSGSLRYKADGGKILVSSDNGRTWTLHTNLGPMYRVDKVGADKSGTVRASVDYLGRAFGLRLAPNLRWWLTA